MNRNDCLALDAADPLAALRAEFLLPEGTLYLDGNSLGACPKATPSRLAQVVQHEWAQDLIQSWNTAGWIDLARRVGDKIARLVGADAGELVVADSTSVNLYKVLKAAVQLRPVSAARHIVSERSNFPTDLYIAESVAREHGLSLRLVDADEVPSALDDQAAILMLTHVNYRTGRVHDMARLSAAAHAAGALTVWDLAHSAGALPVDLKTAGADFAVGCGYKYLNGGPGAPAFVWAHPKHTARMDQEQLRQPLSGWLGHAAPFAFDTAYRPAPGIQRFVCGTPAVLSLAALDCGLDVFGAAEAYGGLPALRRKSLGLSALFIDRVEASCPALTLVTPRDPAERGSQVSFAHAHGYAMMQALIARGVVGDFRAGAPGAATPETADLLRFGLTPLYTRYVDVWDAAAHLAAVLDRGEWRDPRHARRATVT
ncbi:MAG: kynureninase [Pseudomonadota bacterium]|nr:kynureninase [Pseudomonadota bacterium]